MAARMTITRKLLIFLVVFVVVKMGDTKITYYRNKDYYGYQDYLSRNDMMMTNPTLLCDGEENLKSDIGTLSFVLGGISSVAGLFSLTEFSVPSNNISIGSTILSLVLWVPSAILTFWAWSDPVSWVTGNLVNVGSLIVTLYGGLGIVTGTADILVSTMDELLGISGLILSALTTFPDMYDELKEVLEDILGKEVVDNWIRGYGCGGSNTGQTGIGFLRKMTSG